MKIKIGASHSIETIGYGYRLWYRLPCGRRWCGGVASVVQGSVGLCAGRERVLVYNAVLLFLPGIGRCCIIWLVFVVVRYTLL